MKLPHPTKVTFEFNDNVDAQTPEFYTPCPMDREDFTTVKSALKDIFGPTAQDTSMFIDTEMRLEEATIRLHPSCLSDPDLGAKLTRAAAVAKKIYN